MSDRPTLRPTLLNSCAAAATAREARFRIDAGPQPARATRVVALDRGAEELVRPYVDEPWGGAQFLSYAGGEQPGDLFDDVPLRTADGGRTTLSDALDDADFAMMVATSGDGAAAASAIGTACTLRGIMTAGLIVGESASAAAAVTALRPHARVLLVSTDGADVAEVLSAVGA
jgi:hypothetical protein